jgi:beta-glucosidase
MAFRDDFVWGAATAAYQVEGAAFQDGRGYSVWDMLSRRPGAVWNGHTGDVACDHYNRFEADVDLMREVGLKAYRFSISWPRVLPSGRIDVNGKGISFYDRLVDKLLASDITPWPTLFHWDFPYALYRQGSWLNPDSPKWFADYAALMVDVLSDRVSHWMTFNEPQVFIQMGYGDGVHAPGDRLGFRELLHISHNVLLAHGLGVQAIRAGTKQPAQVGFAWQAAPVVPATDHEDDIAVAREENFLVKNRNMWSLSWFSDPIFLKQYPEEGVALFGGDMPHIGPDDFDIIGQPVDFYGINIYFGQTVRAGADGSTEQVPYGLGQPRTTFDWPIVPDTLRWGPYFVWERYKVPVYVTENGMANIDIVTPDGHVHDPQRIEYTRRYLNALRQAGDDGADIRGYFHWSFLDNFEWAEGYKQRFGMVYVDYVTQQRILKDTAHWYREVIRANGANI